MLGPDRTAVDRLGEFGQDRGCFGAGGHQPGQDLSGGGDAGFRIRGRDDQRLPQQRRGRGTGPVRGQTLGVDLAGLMDLRGVDGAGDHLEPAAEVQLVLG